MERFWSKVCEPHDPNSCWEWTAARTSRGYGHFRVGATCQLAHRTAWSLARGSVPDGLCVLHSCDNPPCVNPAHLFLGTRADNAADMVRKGRSWTPMGIRHRALTHCPQGHPYDEVNTRVKQDKKGRTSRECRTCDRLRARAKYQRLAHG